jgi:hypothetical protein
VLLLYPAFGPSKKKETKRFLLDYLEDDDIIKYKLIFENNNIELVKNFF